jgi:hypothetical protein
VRGKPAGSPITWRRLRWFGSRGEHDGPTVGDLVVSAAGHAAYLVEEVTDTGREGHDDEDGHYRLFRVEATKLDPADVEEPDWVIRFS